MRIKKYATALADPALLLYKAAQSYVKTYEGYSYRFHKNGEARLLRQLARHNIKTVFDVGANVGDWSLIAIEHFPGADIHAFELSDTTYRVLSQQGQAAGFTANPFGLSDQAGDIVYKDYGDGSTFNTIVTDVAFHDAKITATERRGQLRRGDDYCAEHGIERIDLLKIDVEGAEHLVLQGFERMLSEKRIALVQFEYGFANGDAHVLMKDFYALFQSYGYVLGPLKPKGAIFGAFDYRLNNFKSGPNYVAVAEDRRDLIDAVAGPSIKGFF